MKIKLSYTQSVIVEHMQKGAYLINAQHMDGHEVTELVALNDQLIYRITTATFNSLLKKGVIEPMKRKGYYKLVRSYRS